MPGVRSQKSEFRSGGRDGECFPHRGSTSLLKNYSCCHSEPCDLAQGKLREESAFPLGVLKAKADSSARQRTPGFGMTSRWIFQRAATQSGVTLMELLVVVAIASILLAIVFPAAGSGLGTLELRSAATRLAAAARYARDQAVYRQRIYQLEIDGAAGSLSVSDLEGGGERSYQFPPSVRVEVVLPEEHNAPANHRRLFFFPDGSAPDFEVILANTRRQLAVIGDPLTGTAKVVER